MIVVVMWKVRTGLLANQAYICLCLPPDVNLPLRIDRPGRMLDRTQKGHCAKQCIFASASHRQDLTQGQMTRNLDYSGG